MRPFSSGRKTWPVWERRESCFDNVPAESPDDRFLQLACALNARGQLAQRLDGENVGQTIEKIFQRSIAGRRLCEIGDSDFALT